MRGSSTHGNVLGASVNGLEKGEEQVSEIYASTWYDIDKALQLDRLKQKEAESV
jgi:hypothetical protein